MQVAIDADTRLVVATGDPQPGNRNDCTVYRTSGIDQKLAGRPVMADGGYQGNPDVIMPYRKPADGTLTDWQEDLNAIHRKVRARVEHALARMKCWKILRDYLIRTRAWWLELCQPHHLRAAVAVVLKALHEAYSFEISVA